MEDIVEFISFNEDAELKELLFKNFEEQECIITTKSSPKCTKKSRETGELFTDIFSKEIVCKSIRKVLVGSNYRKLINKFSQDYVEDFNLKNLPLDLPWGEWVEGSNSLIYYKETYYFRVYSIEKGAIKCYIYNDGKMIENDKNERLSEFLPIEKEDTTQKVLVNNIKLSSILRLQFNDRVLGRKNEI
jgi:hypothetical protein